MNCLSTALFFFWFLDSKVPKVQNKMLRKHKNTKNKKDQRALVVIPAKIHIKLGCNIC